MEVRGSLVFGVNSTSSLVVLVIVVVAMLNRLAGQQMIRIHGVFGAFSVQPFLWLIAIAALLYAPFVSLHEYQCFPLRAT